MKPHSPTPEEAAEFEAVYLLRGAIAALDERRAHRISSAELAEELNPYGVTDQVDLARRLKPAGVRSRTMRLPDRGGKGNDPRKGYSLGVLIEGLERIFRKWTGGGSGIDWTGVGVGTSWSAWTGIEDRITEKMLDEVPLFQMWLDPGL